MLRRIPEALFWALALPAALWLTSCRSCRDDEAEEAEERAQKADHFWRAQIAISGKGRVKSFVQAFDCASDGSAQAGDCGPKLIRFKELSPPTIEALAAPGWRFDHWESQIQEPDGAVAPRSGRMPDGRVYLNGFGYTDTGELETVRPVFVKLPDAG